MLPLSLLKTAQGHPMLVELKNGETYNGHLVNCDTWMNIHLREVICTSKDGDRFWRMPECYIRGNTIKYLRVPDEVIDKVQEDTKSRTGFLKPANGEALETTARGFLQDLIDRNLILVCKLGWTGSIKSCKIHDLVRDMCLKEGQKEGFYHVIGKCNLIPQGMNTQRRVVIPRNTSKKKVRGYLRSMPHARSIICEHGKVPPCRNLGLLRTLHAYKLQFDDDRSYVKSLAFGYVNLRHLAIKVDDVLSFLSSVSLLWNLHTLIVSCPYKHTFFFDDFWKMPQLRHIEFVPKCLCLPDPPRDGREVIMENLHTLKGVMDFKCSEDVVKRIPNVKKLKLRYDGLRENAEQYCVGNIQSLCRLESLSVCNVFDRKSNTYMQQLTFPHSLKKLSLEMNGKFEWDDGMLEKIGLLPHLEKLKLWNGCFGKGKWETFEGQFPCLKFLELFCCSGLEQWTAAEEGSHILPRLEHLFLFVLEYLKEIPCELGNIDTLKEIRITWCGEGAVKSAKEMVDEQVELQGGEDQLSFHVVVKLLLGKDEHLKSLSGPNFQVK